MTQKDKVKWQKKLHKYWVNFLVIDGAYWKCIGTLEAKMSKDLGEELGFFRVDGDIVGIGHKDYSKRKSFPLFQREDISQQNS